MIPNRSAANRDLDAEAVDALTKEAEHVPPGPARSKALTKADRLRHTPEIYKHLFSTELKSLE
jgi:hypothetical protein